MINITYCEKGCRRRHRHRRRIVKRRPDVKQTERYVRSVRTRTTQREIVGGDGSVRRTRNRMNDVNPVQRLYFAQLFLCVQQESAEIEKKAKRRK